MSYERLTKRAGFHKDIDLKDEWGYSHIYQRLSELENKIEDGQLVQLKTPYCTYTHSYNGTKYYAVCIALKGVIDCGLTLQEAEECLKGYKQPCFDFGNMENVKKLEIEEKEND